MIAQSFFRNTKAEFLKCKRSAALWLTIAGAAFIPGINVIRCLAKPDYFVSKMQADPWGVFLDYNWQIAASFMLVMYVILVTSLIVQIEFKNETWKQVYSSPRPVADIFFAKFLVVHFVIISCFVLFNVFIIIFGYFVGLLNDQYSFFLHPLPGREMISISIRMYTSILAILGIQYWLNMRFGNFIVPIGIGLALFTCGFMVRQWEHIDYYPYMYPLLVYFKNPGLFAGVTNSALVHSVLWLIVGLVVGFLDIARRREIA